MYSVSLKNNLKIPTLFIPDNENWISLFFKYHFHLINKANYENYENNKKILNRCNKEPESKFPINKELISKFINKKNLI